MKINFTDKHVEKDLEVSVLFLDSDKKLICKNDNISDNDKAVLEKNGAGVWGSLPPPRPCS